MATMAVSAYIQAEEEERDAEAQTQVTPATPTPPLAPQASSSPQQTEDLHDMCAICLVDYEDNEMLKLLPCDHRFHPACIDEWLTRNNACPMCKASVDPNPHSIVAPPASPPPSTVVAGEAGVELNFTRSPVQANAAVVDISLDENSPVQTPPPA